MILHLSVIFCHPGLDTQEITMKPLANRRRQGSVHDESHTLPPLTARRSPMIFHMPYFCYPGPHSGNKINGNWEAHLELCTNGFLLVKFVIRDLKCTLIYNHINNRTITTPSRCRTESLTMIANHPTHPKPTKS